MEILVASFRFLGNPHGKSLTIPSGSGRLRFEHHSHDLFQVSIPQRRALRSWKMDTIPWGWIFWTPGGRSKSRRWPFGGSSDQGPLNRPEGWWNGFQKYGENPQIIHLFIGVSLIFTIRFGGFSTEEFHLKPTPYLVDYPIDHKMLGTMVIASPQVRFMIFMSPVVKDVSISKMSNHLPFCIPSLKLRAHT